MLRILLAISLCCLLSLSSGLTLNVHFCMNQVADVTLFSSSDHHCNFCGMQEESDGCCHQEKQLVKLIQDQYPPHFFNYTIVPATAFIPAEQPPLSTIQVQALGSVAGTAERPPDRASVPLYVSHCDFRI
ncbi:MAG: HYC_CC_PP family protein [Sphingomonadales bacterium]